MPRKTLAVLVLSTLAALTPSCAGFYPSDPTTTPGLYDRPAIIRAPARAGALLFAVPGIVLTIVLWPVTKTLNLLFDEPLGYSKREWAFLPLTSSVAVGHHALGLPGEAIHYACYRAWAGEPQPVGFDHVPGPAAAPTSPPRH